MDSSENTAVASSEAGRGRTFPLTLVSNRAAFVNGLKSGNLGAFLAEVGERIHELKVRKLAPAEFTNSVFEILTSFLVRETGSRNLEDSMGLLFHQMWGGGAELRLLADLYYRLRKLKVQSSQPASWQEIDFDQSRFLTELEAVLCWYGRRKVSLSVLDEELPRDHEADVLFGVRLFDGRIRHGVPGFEVVCGLRLSGHADEQLWLKVQFRDGTNFLKGKHAWLDQSGLNYCTRSTEGRVSAVLPISPDHQRLIVDEAKVFIPYVALGVQPGKQTLETVLSLVAEDGAELLVHSQVHTFVVPPCFEIREVSSFSPHLLGMWENDVARGDGLFDFGVDTSAEALTIKGNVSLFDRDEKDVKLECRLLHEDETEITLSDRYRDLLSATLIPDRPVRFYANASFSIPLLALNLEEGHHEILVEVVLIASNGRLLFGTREMVCVEIAALTVDNPLAVFLN